MWQLLNHWLKHRHSVPSYTGNNRLNQGAHNVQRIWNYQMTRYEASRGLEEHHVSNHLWNSPNNFFNH